MSVLAAGDPVFPTEAAFQRAVIKQLRARGYWVIRANASHRRGHRGEQNLESGTPDLLLVGLGWLELKRVGGSLRPAQIRWHEAAKLLGERVWTVDTIAEALEVAERWMEESGLSKESFFRCERIRKEPSARVRKRRAAA